MMDKKRTQLLMDLMDYYTDNICKTVDNKMYELVTRSQLVKIIEDFKPADPMPTKKVCDKCGGRGYNLLENHEGDLNKSKCHYCKDGKIQIYYTPEQYEKIMGKPFKDDAMVWYKCNNFEWIVKKYKLVSILLDHTKTVIVQTNQPAPEADYRPEEV